ncbi:BQ5605_C004g03067 [Microbotryum silenes-dioicae]|uniref:BQ5605_C004g03067 protein n=1 Tax=Microbotryum silenes-dioicae TaxID=796604 RepID=A0A2X0MDR9_9BASI|nr:BQ5605_C004g03067 [Microbotryum silenes-dioicae]
MNCKRCRRRELESSKNERTDQLDALGRAKRVMYGRFGAPEDKEEKKQGAVGGAIANGNANADRHG